MIGRLFKISLSGNRVFGLDLLRAFAIATVIYSHSIYFIESVELKSTLRIFHLDGVTMFFVLSGFLIGQIIIRDFESKPANFQTVISFWKRRWFRTLPAYFLVLLAAAFFQNPPKLVLLKYSIFSQNLWEHYPFFFREAWSISVEEWFYLSLPILLLVCLMIGAKLRRGLGLVIVIFGVMGPAMRIMQFQIHDPGEAEFWGLFIRGSVFCRMDSLALGVWGAYLSRYSPAAWMGQKRAKFLAGLIICMLPVLLDDYRREMVASPEAINAVFYYWFEPLGTFLMLPFLSSYHLKQSAFALAVTHISVISYAMYLLNHSLIMLELIPWGQRLFMPPERGLGWQMLSVVFFVLTTLVLSTLFYKLYEAPCTRLRDRVRFPWEPKRG